MSSSSLHACSLYQLSHGVVRGTAHLNETEETFIICFREITEHIAASTEPIQQGNPKLRSGVNIGGRSKLIFTIQQEPQRFHNLSQWRPNCPRSPNHQSNMVNLHLSLCSYKTGRLTQWGHVGCRWKEKNLESRWTESKNELQCAGWLQMVPWELATSGRGTLEWEKIEEWLCSAAARLRQRWAAVDQVCGVIRPGTNQSISHSWLTASNCQRSVMAEDGVVELGNAKHISKFGDPH